MGKRGGDGTVKSQLQGVIKRYSDLPIMAFSAIDDDSHHNPAIRFNPKVRS
jgi:hypothetical protein